MQGEGRSRRRAVTERGGKKFRNALEELRELKKTGKRRVDEYEYHEEEDVYDEVNEDEYARIVQKRREEGGAYLVFGWWCSATPLHPVGCFVGSSMHEFYLYLLFIYTGGFVVGNDGLGYTDIGEEIEWVNEDAREHERTMKGNSKKSATAGGGRKKQAVDEPVPGAKERMQKMFQSAAVRAKAAAAPKAVAKTVNAVETDALLDDIIGDLTTPSTDSHRTPVSARRTVTRPSAGHSRMNPMSKPRYNSAPTMPVANMSFQTPRQARGARVHFAPDSLVKSHQKQLPEPVNDCDDHFPQQEYDDFGPMDDGDTCEHEDDVEKVEHEEDITMEAATKEVEEPVEEKNAEAAMVTDWQALYEDEEEMGDVEETPWVDDGSLQLDDQSLLSLYLIDAHEEISQPGTVYLFGKTPVGDGQHTSCCTVVKNVQKTLFVVPKEPVDLPLDLLESCRGDKDVQKEKMGMLHKAFADVKAEIRQILGKHGIAKMTMKPVLRTYAFEDTSVSHGKQWVLKVRYPFGKAIPVNMDGHHFAKVFGTTQTCLEALLLKRRIMGPSWVHIAKPTRVSKGSQVSFCNIEVEVEGHKAIKSAPMGWKPAPPICVASLSLKTVINPDTAANEIVGASVVYMPKVNTDGPLPVSKRDIRHFSAIRKLDGMGYPAGFDLMAKKANESELGKRNGGNIIALQPNERALLTMLVMKLKDMDVDAFVGHNFSGFDLDVLLHRMKELKVPHWSSLGRLKRSKFPNLGGGGYAYGGGAGAGALSVVAGRLICDTYLAARDLVRETEYTLTALSKNLLGELRLEINSADIKSRFLSSQKLLEMVQHTESDAWLAMRLASYLAVLPLTRQLAELSGSLWSKALLNQRAQRIEYLLLHEFHNNKFILPDKLSAKDRAATAEGSTAKKNGKGPQYAGGLVLEPKKGLYDRYILLLDFNSLYPSIIQEYNICFTTVERPQEGTMAKLPDANGEKAPLPKVIGALVERRRRVKDMIKGERDTVKKEQLNIRQQALKLLANSMYGCLGFSNSRFYAKPLAELITSQGREILQSTVELVQGNIGRNVIYGDTDSIMVDTSTEELADVISLGHIIKKEVNKRYRLLEIEMDGVFKRMLLLKKKKYAAVKIERGPDGKDVEVVEAKGLDMVRRDWCPLAKQASQFCLDQILSGKPREEVIGAIHEHLSTLGSSIREGNVPLNKFLITKQLTKRPEDYPDAKNQPHVQVALRRRAAGKRDGVMPGETIPYIICMADGEEVKSESLADRARSPEEISSGAHSLKVDVDYYITQQVFPVICRLVAPIEGTDAFHIAESLGMDASKFKVASTSINPDEALEIALSGLDNEDRFKDCLPLKLETPAGKNLVFNGVRNILKEDDVASAFRGQGEDAPLTPAQISNQARLRARASIKKYYEGWLTSDDEMLPCRTRNICLRDLPDSMPGTAPPDLKCSGNMHPEVSEAKLYTELSYLYRLFDVDGALQALGQNNKEAKEAALSKLAPLKISLDYAAAQTAKIQNKSGYRWVNLSSVFGSLRSLKKKNAKRIAAY